MNKRKKILIGVLSCLLLLLIILFICFIIKKNNLSNMEVPEGYIAVFHGGGTEVNTKTYIYKVDNGHANYGFKYVNTTEHTESWGSPNWVIEVTGKGEVMWTDDVFTVAEKNHATSFVTLPNSNKTYTLDEFAGMFLMN